MAKDPVVQLRVWNSYAMLAHQRDSLHTQAVDAGYAAQSTDHHPRDPFFSSLAHARTAIGHSNLGDRQAAIRSLGYAQEALSKAPLEEPRPSWMAFYGVAELTAMTAIVRDRIGDSAQAEAASHKALSGIPVSSSAGTGPSPRLGLPSLNCTSGTSTRRALPLPGRSS
jgi:hypothetical protein